MSKIFIACVVVLGLSFAIFALDLNKDETPKPKEKIEKVVVQPEPEQEEPPAPALTQEEVTANKEASKQIAIEFSKAYYNYDSANPLAYIEASKPYMEESFYEFEKTHPRKPTLDREKTEVKEVDIYPLEDNQRDYDAVWNVIVVGEATGSQGQKIKEELWYWVLMDYEEGKWIVKGVELE